MGTAVHVHGKERRLHRDVPLPKPEPGGVHLLCEVVPVKHPHEGQLVRKRRLRVCQHGPPEDLLQIRVFHEADISVFRVQEGLRPAPELRMLTAGVLKEVHQVIAVVILAEAVGPAAVPDDAFH